MTSALISAAHIITSNHNFKLFFLQKNGWISSLNRFLKTLEKLKLTKGVDMLS